VVPVSAKFRTNMEKFYKELFKMAG
jgi:hypothetical protein